MAAPSPTADPGPQLGPPPGVVRALVHRARRATAHRLHLLAVWIEPSPPDHHYQIIISANTAAFEDALAESSTILRRARRDHHRRPRP